MGGIIVVEPDIKALEIFRVVGVDFLNQFFGCDSGVAGANHNRCAVSVVGTEIQAVIAAELLEPHPDVRLAIFHNMTYMDWGVCIRQGGGDDDFTRHNFPSFRKGGR